MTAPHWLVLSEGESRTEQHALTPRRLFAGVAAIAIVVVIAVALISVLVARGLAESEAVADAADRADTIAESQVQPSLQDGLLTGSAEALATMDATVHDQVLSAAIIRVKIWDDTGRIVYSDEPRLIGQRFELEEEELEVLRESGVESEVSDLAAPENRYERSSGKLLEAYRGVSTPSGERLLFETYFRYDAVVARSAALWSGFAGIALGSILAVLLLLTPVFLRLLRQLRRGQESREGLLRRALDASEDERRRIAGTLHDGVVQSLVAASYSFAGSAQRAAASGDERGADEFRDASAVVRTSIAGLRTLLVDIYPPSLAMEGLPVALRDLATPLRSRGVSVTIDIDDDLMLSEEADRLVFRVAQECLINTAKHAEAPVVAITLRRSDTRRTVLEVTDDGTGFDADLALAREHDGHFGLRILADVAADAGATLSLRTAPGAGTTWRLVLP